MPSPILNEWLDIATAPRDGTWVELSYIADGEYHDRGPARSSGRGDRPNIWRFADCSCLLFEHERLDLEEGEPGFWFWRPILDESQAAIQAAYDKLRWKPAKSGSEPIDMLITRMTSRPSRHPNPVPRPGKSKAC
ncbi:hypothetical protein [Erythrobacter aureus]|uniref:Uncharacterized protein n=1 Tax=Erythrobacter aureus TaxID=2182384 RepID=A0A345YIW0_9SPHN|nr:hypothetical protein [Erythrobacter aureus]AXK43862.1 hypothetical protein DVR09_15520 [Erythrobacter aureus]